MLKLVSAKSNIGVPFASPEKQYLISPHIHASLPVTVIETSEYRNVLVPDLIDEITYEQTTSYIHHYQEVTKDRISNVILEMKDRLASFDVQE